jgi:hypothetical protein
MAVRSHAPVHTEDANHSAYMNLLGKLQPTFDKSGISGASLHNVHWGTGHEMSSEKRIPGVTPENSSIQPKLDVGISRRPVAGIS